MVASNFVTNQENFKKESCLNVITPFTIIVDVLQLRGVPKTVIWVHQNGGHKQSLGEAWLPWPPPHVATTLTRSNLFPRYSYREK